MSSDLSRSDLFWPGSERSGDLLTEATWLNAMVAVEQAWSDALAEAGVSPGPVNLSGLVTDADVAVLAAGAESTGNPVPELAKLLRSRATGEAAGWVHRGLTSQDVIDTALVLALRDAVDTVRDQLTAQIESLIGLAERHWASVMPGRTLTQWAVPTTFGLKAAGWLDGVLAAAERLETVNFPIQLGGAAGTHAATAELLAATGRDLDPFALTQSAAVALGLEPALPWHTSRAPVTAIADALVGCTDAWGRIAGDVLTGSRSEIAELAEPAGGGSSTMPHKRNPALSVLVRRAAIAAPGLAGTIHLAAALAHDERSSGPWHTEWSTMATLGRRTVIAGSQLSEVLAGLHVDVDRMAATVAEAAEDLTAEQRSIAAFAGANPTEGHYLGANDTFIDTALSRAKTWLENH